MPAMIAAKGSPPTTGEAAAAAAGDRRS
jgi:hypothetical protein